MDNSHTERQLLRGEAVAAVGLLTEETTSFQTAVLFMKLLDDPVVNQRCEELGFEVDEETSLETAVRKYDIKDVTQIIKAMTPAERQALRERIAARL